MSERRVFVAGATGFTGREVVRQLRAEGHRVTAHIRPESAGIVQWESRFAEWGAETVVCAWDVGALTEVLRARAIDLVFALVGATLKQAKREGIVAKNVHDEIDYKLTAILIDAAVASSLQPRFVYLSAIGASSRSRSTYYAARGRCEAKLRGSGLPFTICRPSFIVGERDVNRPLENAAAAVTDTLLGGLGALGFRRVRDRYASVDNVEIARSLIAAGLDPAADGAILHGDELRRLREGA